MRSTFADSQHVRYDEDGKAQAQEASDQALMTVDSWLHLRVPLQQVAHICCLRHRLTQAFAAKVVCCARSAVPALLFLALPCPTVLP